MDANLISRVSLRFKRWKRNAGGWKASRGAERFVELRSSRRVLRLPLQARSSLPELQCRFSGRCPWPLRLWTLAPLVSAGSGALVFWGSGDVAPSGASDADEFLKRVAVG